jgi:hypothetical protein
MHACSGISLLHIADGISASLAKNCIAFQGCGTIQLSGVSGVSDVSDVSGVSGVSYDACGSKSCLHTGHV